MTKQSFLPEDFVLSFLRVMEKFVNRFGGWTFSRLLCREVEELVLYVNQEPSPYRFQINPSSTKPFYQHLEPSGGGGISPDFHRSSITYFVIIFSYITTRRIIVWVYFKPLTINFGYMWLPWKIWTRTKGLLIFCSNCVSEYHYHIWAPKVGFLMITAKLLQEHYWYHYTYWGLVAKV